MILTKKVNKENFYITYYKALNGILNLTNKEIEVLSKLSLILNQKQEMYITNEVRSEASDRLGISKHNFNNLFKKIKDRGFIVEDKDKGNRINPFLYKSMEDVSEITFRFELDK